MQLVKKSKKIILLYMLNPFSPSPNKTIFLPKTHPMPIFFPRSVFDIL